MRKEHAILAALLITLSAATITLLAAVTLLYHGENTKPATETPATAPSTTSSSTPQPPQTTTTTKFHEIGETTTSSTPLNKTLRLEVTLPEKTLYKNDEAEIKVTSQGLPVEGARMSLDGGYEGATGSQGSATLYRLEGGKHVLYVEKQGFESRVINFEVSPVRYGLSSEVKEIKTAVERERLIDAGKIVFVFYDRPNCPNCMRMKPWAADVVEANRECVSYELLSLVYDGPRQELKDLFPDEDFVDTPILVFDGPAGKTVMTGLMSAQAIEAYVKAASDGGCRIK